MSLVVTASPNIALIKYWGKKTGSNSDGDRNLPLNSSLSLTLSQATTKVTLTPATQWEFQLNGQLASPTDRDKIKKHIERVEAFAGKAILPFRMQSVNNFPMGTGIASSASAFAAMSCAFLAWATTVERTKSILVSDNTAIANLARRGSGSAARSLEGPFVQWNPDGSTQRINSDWKLFDTIVIFSSEQKKVSSSQGHLFATQSPYFPTRQANLSLRLEQLKLAIAAKDLPRLGALMEEEAEEMHRVMLDNPHPINYRLPSTEKFIQLLKTMPGRNFFYTLDAGPNVHLISEAPIAADVQKMLIRNELAANIWEDFAGFGPTFES